MNPYLAMVTFTLMIIAGYLIFFRLGKKWFKKLHLETISIKIVENMTVADARIVSDSEREAYLKELYQKIVEENDQGSLKQLSSIAAGRNDLPLAKELIAKLEIKKWKKIFFL